VSILKILSLEEVPLPIVKKMLQSAEARGVKLKDIQRRVLEHASMFSKCDDEATRDIVKTLTSMGLREITSAQIVNICPRGKNELLTLMGFENRAHSEDVMDKILEILRERCNC